jgi:hypothetical protein
MEDVNLCMNKDFDQTTKALLEAPIVGPQIISRTVSFKLQSLKRA